MLCLLLAVACSINFVSAIALLASYTLFSRSLRQHPALVLLIPVLVACAKSLISLASKDCFQISGLQFDQLCKSETCQPQIRVLCDFG